MSRPDQVQFLCNSIEQLSPVTGGPHGRQLCVSLSMTDAQVAAAIIDLHGDAPPQSALIDAAPDLLAALKMAYRHLNGGSDSLSPMEHAAAHRMSRAAIAKAEGVAL